MFNIYGSKLNKLEGCINARGIVNGHHDIVTHGLWPPHMQYHKPHDVFFIVILSKLALLHHVSCINFDVHVAQYHVALGST
jgi:hypothetical protein